MVAWVRLAAAGVVFGMTGAASAQQSADDPYIWLEEVQGARATEWVKAENQKALATLQSDPRYEPFYEARARCSRSQGPDSVRRVPSR